MQAGWPKSSSFSVDGAGQPDAGLDVTPCAGQPFGPRFCGFRLLRSKHDSLSNRFWSRFQYTLSVGSVKPGVPAPPYDRYPRCTVNWSARAGCPALTLVSLLV